MKEKTIKCGIITECLFGKSIGCMVMVILKTEFNIVLGGVVELSHSEDTPIPYNCCLS